MKTTVASMLGWLLAAGPASAQGQPDTVRFPSLDAVIASAVQHNPTQAIYQQQLKQAAYSYKASRSLLLPQASAGFTGTDNLHLATTPVPGELVGRPGTTFYAQFGKPYIYNTGLTLSQSIFDWTFVLQSRLAKNNLQLSQVQQASYEQSLKEQVTRLYYSALIAQSALRINQTDYHLADTLQRLAQQRLQEGTSDLLAANQAAINYQNVQQSQAQSQQLLDQSLSSLKLLLGAAPASELRLTETLNLTALPPDAVPDLQPDKALAVYEQQASIATLQSLSQRAAAYPTISASGYFGAQQFRDEFGVSFNSNAWTGYRYIGLNVAVPLFTGFANTNKYKSALVQRDIARLQADQARQESATNDQLLQKNYADYLRLVRSSAASFRLYGDNLRLTQQKYREGILAMDAYLRLFQDYLTAENAYLNNLSLLFSTQATILSRQ